MKKTFLEKIQWKRINWISSIYKIYVILLVVSSAAIFTICCNFKSESIVYNMGNSIFTGIIASIIVSIIIQIKQDKEQFERKKAILFDAGFYLKEFENNYRGKKICNPKLDDDWSQLFDLCREPAEYLSKMYGNGLDIFDVLDITILRLINSKYRLIMSLSKEISFHKKDKKFLRDTEQIMKVYNIYDEQIRTLKDNLFKLLIKWQKDSIID